LVGYAIPNRHENLVHAIVPLPDQIQQLPSCRSQRLQNQVKSRHNQQKDPKHGVSQKFVGELACEE
jgi:hypothetical protein